MASAGGRAERLAERARELVVVNKMDLPPYLGFDLNGFLDNLRKVNPAGELIFVSARTGDGIDAW
jgi:hydrogenase nickel incorporation protein HypB